jgi:hypothetical protein
VVEALGALFQAMAPIVGPVENLHADC